MEFLRLIPKVTDNDLWYEPEEHWNSSCPEFEAPVPDLRGLLVGAQSLESAVKRGYLDNKKLEVPSVAEFGEERVVIAGPDAVHRFVAGDPALHHVAGATGLGPADKDVVDPAVGF